MSFDSLPPQLPIFPPEAEAYSRRALELSREAVERCNVVVDVPYGPDVRQTMDIYRSSVPSEASLAVLLFVHGGAWTNGYKEWMGLLAPAVTDFPAIFISVSCRLAPEHRFPTPFHDFVEALSWVYRNIDSYGGDAERIHVGGHSSGGHLTSLAALRVDELRAAGLPDSVIKACFPVSTRFDLVFDNPAADSTEYRHQSMLFSADQNAVLASPLHQIGRCRTPFLLAHGSRDIPAIIENNERMFAALRRAGTPVERLVLPEFDHFDMAVETRHPEGAWMKAVKRWMSPEQRADVAR